MRLNVACHVIVLAATGIGLPLVGQTPPGREQIPLPIGTKIGLELQDGLNSKHTTKGEIVEFKVTPDVQAGGRIAIPREAVVEATITVAKRAGPARKRGELRMEFTKLTLADGTSIPLAAKVTRVGRWHRTNQITADAPGDRDVMQDMLNIVQLAGVGAGVGAMVGSSVATAAAAGAAAGIVAILMERGPDLDLPPGIMFQIELTKPLEVPMPSEREPVLAAAVPPPAQSPVSAVPPVPPPAPPPDPVLVPPIQQEPLLTASLPATPPPPPDLIPPPVMPSAIGADQTVTFKSDVNLILVEATVRDSRGAIYIKLKAEDFQVFEDGVQQEIRHFTRDELPLAIALVIDRSGSVAPIMSRLRRAAREILSQLKPADEVALFSFDTRPVLIEELTKDRQRIADRMAMIQAGGGTNIKDALYEAATYLAREAPSRRRAIILISDNVETVDSRMDESQVIRAAMETESVVYGIRVADGAASLLVGFPVKVPRGGAVNRIAQDTGGEVLDTRELGSVEAAMQSVITRLKLRFTLGYQSKNTIQDGTFRRIEVRLTDKAQANGPFTIYHRRGYHAARPGQRDFPPPETETSLLVGRSTPQIRPASTSGWGEPATSRPFTNDDVLKLVKAGFSEEAILEAIQKNSCRFDTSAEALLALKSGGVGEKIVMAMLGARQAPNLPSAPDTENGPVPTQAGVYLVKEGRYVAVEFEAVHWSSGFWGGPTTIGNTTRHTLNARMPSVESPLRLAADLEFLLVGHPADKEFGYDLLRAESNRKEREFRAEFLVLDDGTYVVQGGTRKSKVAFTARQISAGAYLVKLQDPAKGEFAFVPKTIGLDGRLYTFGVR